MLFLADFSVMNPSFGLLFWTSIVFLLVWFVLGKVAFKPIINALQNREKHIDEALHQAEKAREEMKQIHSKHEELLKQASEERIRIIREAEALRERIVEEAKTKSEEITRKMVDAAKDEIENRRQEMEISLFNEIGKISLGIARQIIQKELAGQHDAFVSQKVSEFKQQRLAAKN
jgi:F-type H+-transporting ATPase subunit b